MLRAQPERSPTPTAKEAGFVPEMYLSSYVHEQLSALHYCDTITVDPHKSGFCQSTVKCPTSMERRVLATLASRDPNLGQLL